MRLWIAAALLSLLVAPAASFAAAGNSTTKNDRAVSAASKEIDKARELVNSSVEAFARGDQDKAYELARSAYIDHYEKAEIPLRLRDSNLVLDAEFSFAELRNGIEAGDSEGKIKSKAREVRSYLDLGQRKLADKGFAAPVVAAGFSFSIIFREGLEAVLMIAILLGTLEAGRAAGFRKPLTYGVIAAAVATLLTWLLTLLVIDIAPVNRELISGIAGLLAVVVLFIVTFWLVSRVNQKRWMEFMRSRVSSAIATGSALAFAGLGFTAVYREGFETVLFYQTLILFAEGLLSWVLAGLVAGLIVLAGVGWVILRMGRRLPIRAFMAISAAVVLTLSIAFIGNTVHALQEADVIAVHPVGSSLVRLPVYIADLTGIHATWEGLAAQAALAVIYFVGIGYMFVLRPLSLRRRAIRVGA